MLAAIRNAASALGVAALAIDFCAGSAFAGDVPESSSTVESGVRQQGTAPIKIAVFDFELEDLSAAGGTGVSPVETKYLAQATEEAKRKLVESGRYSIDIGRDDRQNGLCARSEPAATTTRLARGKAVIDR